MNAPLLQQQVVLSVTKNMVQLIDLICEGPQKLDDVPLNTSFVITGRYPVPMEVKSKALVQRIDLKTIHEEADIIIHQRVVALAGMGCNIINVICTEDTYVCTTLPLLSVSLIIEPTSRSRSSIDIGTTVAKQSGIVSQLIAAHAVSGCDTVECCLGIGKTNVVEALLAGIELNHLGDLKDSLDHAMKESTHLIGACYGRKCDPSDTMYSVRYKVWVSRTGRKGASILPKLKSLPPTTEALRENVKRAHFQACIWKSAVQQDPSELDPLDTRRTNRCILLSVTTK